MHARLPNPHNHHHHLHLHRGTKLPSPSPSPRPHPSSAPKHSTNACLIDFRCFACMHAKNDDDSRARVARPILSTSIKKYKGGPDSDATFLKPNAVHSTKAHTLSCLSPCRPQRLFFRRGNAARQRCGWAGAAAMMEARAAVAEDNEEVVAVAASFCFCF